MKILYAVQATGNGHISRAIQLAPFLQKLGEVDIFLSGSNSSLSLSIPVRYRSKGISLFNNFSGGLDYFKMARSNPWITVYLPGYGKSFYENQLSESVQLLADTYNGFSPDFTGLEPDPGPFASIPASR